jgi:hypothetical protein
MATAVVKQEEAAQQVAASQSSAIFSMVERIMMDKDLPVERAHQALEFYQKVQAQAARQAFDEAMANAKAKIPPILKDQHVKYTNKSGDVTEYDHENLSGIAKIVDPILSEFGLSYRFRTTSNLNEPIRVTCIVAHRAGYYEENTLSAGADSTGGKNTIQAIGSTLTYLQRYTLKSSLGLAAAPDDDGKKADDETKAPISEAQLKELAELMVDFDSEQTARFCTYFKIKTVESLPASEFERAKASFSSPNRKGARK